MNLMIVDDEVIALKGMMKGIDWKKAGIGGEIFTAQHAREALEILQEKPVDIILCDIEMPGQNGIELIRAVRGQHPDITVIFQTCHAKFEYAKEAIQLGCFDYILTPAAYGTIQDTVQRAVNERIQQQKRAEMENYGIQWLSQQQKEVAQAQGSHRKQSEMVEDTVRYIYENLESYDLSVSSAAKNNFLNEDYLNRIFKREKGLSINQFVIRERMALAARLLENPSLSITAISSKVGYANYPYFVTTFKKHFGCSPSQYRKGLR